MEEVLEYMLYGDKSSFTNEDSHVEDKWRLSRHLGVNCNCRNAISTRPESHINSTLHCAPLQSLRKDNAGGFEVHALW